MTESRINNVDGILVPREQAMLSNDPIPAQPVEIKEPEPAPIESHDEIPAPEPQDEYGTQAEEPKEPEKTKEVSENPIDEYGNPVEKPRMYSEDEVQRMIRERISRSKYAEPPTQQQVNQAAKDFKADPTSNEPWEEQLETFVEKTIDKHQQKLSEQQWQQEERQRQAEFEDKFSRGMSKYQDFQSVVTGKPITNGIMLAARALENPAAFIYGASKLHPQELDRISKIADPYQQAAEVGRLHERMVKMHKTVSKTSKPLDAPKADVPISRKGDIPSIDNLIAQHAKSKLASRR